jgi:hypothetical protein
MERGLESVAYLVKEAVNFWFAVLAIKPGTLLCAGQILYHWAIALNFVFDVLNSKR